MWRTGAPATWLKIPARLVLQWGRPGNKDGEEYVRHFPNMSSWNQSCMYSSLRSIPVSCAGWCHEGFLQTGSAQARAQVWGQTPSAGLCSPGHPSHCWRLQMQYTHYQQSLIRKCVTRLFAFVIRLWRGNTTQICWAGGISEEKKTTYKEMQVSPWEHPHISGTKPGLAI